MYVESSENDSTSLREGRTYPGKKAHDGNAILQHAIKRYFQVTFLVLSWSHEWPEVQ